MEGSRHLLLTKMIGPAGEPLSPVYAHALVLSQCCRRLTDQNDCGDENGPCVMRTYIQELRRGKGTGQWSDVCRRCKHNGGPEITLGNVKFNSLSATRPDLIKPLVD